MINKKKVEGYISKAIEYVEDEFKECKEKGLPKELHGYISNFGASIIQSGLIPAVAFYERVETTKNDKVAINRRKLMKIIFKLIDENECEEKKLLIEYLVNTKKYQDSKDYKIKSNIIHSAIAIKLVIRLYEQRDNDNKDKKGDKNG